MPDQPAHPTRHQILVAVFALGLLAFGAGPALAQALGCGAVVTQDTTLTGDLLDCPGNGLVVGADGITIDLNGHTISGQIISGGSPDQVGIENRGHDDVTIRNGTITGFLRGGVHLVRADRNRVQDLTMDFFDEFSILLEGGGSANRFTGNHLDRPGEVGISIVGAATASRDNLISGNVSNAANSANIALRSGRITGTLIEGNTANGAQAEEEWGAGIVVSDHTDADIRRTIVRSNRLDENFGGSIFVGGSATDTLVERNALDDNFGVAVESDGDRTLIRRNTITSTLFVGSTLFGIQVDAGAADNRVEANNLDRPGFIGVDDSGTRTLTTANVVIGQIYPAVPATGGIAGIIVREEARDGRIQANVVRRHAPGFAPDVGAGIDVFGDRFTVAANLVSEIDLRDGIRIEPQASGTLLQANITSRNGDDGIDVESPATTVTANLATDNADYGIEAVEGVTDGGGNRASGNGNPAQCLGVRCS
jgi:hypothetical protein